MYIKNLYIGPGSVQGVVLSAKFLGFCVCCVDVYNVERCV